MEFVAPFFAFFGFFLLLFTLPPLIITVFIVIKKEIHNTDKLLLILMIWLIPVIGSIVGLYMLITQYKKDEEI